jgi:hypothetical protein
LDCETREQVDIIRRNEYFKSNDVMNDVRALLDDNSGIPVAARISDFVEAAVEHGYTGTPREDLTAPAQFASVLLSSRWPDRFVRRRRS